MYSRDGRSCGLPCLWLTETTINSIDPEVPVTETMPLIDQVHGAFTDARVASAVLNCAALLGLLLSAVALYAVVSYEVRMRTKEIGMRMALGANSQEIILAISTGRILHRSDRRGVWRRACTSSNNAVPRSLALWCSSK